MHFIIRHAEPTDYEQIISVLNDWWGGRNMCAMLPKLFFIHFRQTSFVAEDHDNLVGFLTGFVSQTFPEEAYIHFAGVHPELRRRNVGRALYERLFAAVAPFGCKLVRCVTSPVNRSSVAFHLRMGFTIQPADASVNGLYIVRDYDGREEDRVLLAKRLEARGPCVGLKE